MVDEPQGDPLRDSVTDTLHGRAASGQEAPVIGIIWNPSKTDRETLEAALKKAVRQESIEMPSVSWFATSAAESRQDLARRAIDEGCTTLIAAGGDGTVREVAEHLARRRGEGPDTDLRPMSEVSLGIVPLGTGNLLARNLRVPLNPAAAFRRILTEPPRSLDVGEVRVTGADGTVNDHVFTVMIGFGIDAQMIVETDDDLKSNAGWLAYVESLGRALSGAAVTDFTLRVDDAAPESDAAHTLLIGNCGSIQGGVTLLPDAVPDDGKLDLLVLRADGIASWLDTLQNMVWENGLMRAFQNSDRAKSSVSTSHLQATSLDVELSAPLQFEIDGDDVGEVTALAIRVRPAALRVH